MRAAFLATLVLTFSACGESDADPAAPVAQEPASRPAVEEADEDEELEPEPEFDEEPNDEEPSVEELSVDEMDERDLEAACFAGRQAACDRLGH